MGVAAFYGTQGTETGSSFKGLNYRSGVGRGVVACHPHNTKGIDAMTPGTTMLYDVCAALARNDLPVVVNDLGGSTTTWGNDASQTKVGDARTWIQANGAKSGAVLLYGSSMGALSALNWARANPTLVAAIALSIPVVDLQYQHDNGNTADIESAYTNLAGFNAAVATHDPIQNAASYVGVPIKVWYASDDTVAFTARQQAFITAVGCQSSNMGAVGHNAGVVPPNEVVAFLAQYA